MEKTALVSEVADLIIKSVNLQHMAKDQLSAETTLTQGGLGLDSVDILEVVVAIEHKYGVKVESAQTGAQHFKTIGTICDFIQANKQ
jgi:acyl carrier protein